MEAEMEGMGLIREANWATCEGSLQNTVIFKPQIPPEEPEMESHPLVLRSFPGSGPCEITLKFRETLCELHSIYVRSTARVFELYNKLELNVDNEYVCTARGELTVWNDDDSKCPRGNLDKDENALPGQESPGGKSSEASVTSPEEIGSQPVLKLQEQAIESTNEQNPSGIPDGNNNGELPNMLNEDSIEIPEELAKNDFHGSDEDNWIEVKFSGSLVMDSPGETGGSSQLQSLGDNENSEGTTDWQMGLSVEDDDGKTSSQDYLDSYNPTQTKDASFHQKLPTENVGNTEISENCFMEKGEDTAARSEENSSPLHRNNLSKKAFYEATVEIVNARPCTSLTIRLLSLQDKSSVEIDEIQVYGLPVPAVTAGTETVGLSSGSSLLGSSFGGSLLAMLLPNMLQMSRAGLSQRRDELFASSPNVRREREMSESGLCVSELSTSSSQSLTSTTLSMEDIGVSAGGYLSSGMAPEKTLPTDLLPYEKKYPHSVSGLHVCLDEVAENVEMDENNLEDTMGRTRTSRHKTDYTCERKEEQVEIGGGTPASGGITSLNEQLPDRLSEPEVRGCFTQCCTKELKSNEVDEGLSERTSGEITLEHLLKRMDKLDALCMRIEAHVHKALNNMERRLQLVESRQMLPNLSVPTKTEDVTLHSGLSSQPNLCLNSLVSCPEILSVNNCKHIHGMGMPSQSCTVLHSSVSMSNVFLGSSADCSSACAASNSSVILPSHASHPVNSMDSEPESMHGLSSVAEPLNACLHESPSDVILDKSMFSSLDQQVISKEEIFLGNSQGADRAKEEISAGSVISGNFISEHPAPAKRPALSIEEALASALSAFSASVGCPRIEATDTSTEAPCCSSKLENSNMDDKDIRYSGGIHFDAIEGLSSHQVETTAVCTAALCGSLEVDITDDKEVCYNDDIVFDTGEGVRYISQEGMDSVPYNSSQGSQDARHILYRSSKIGDSQDDMAVDIKQTCKLGPEIMINQTREIMLSEDKIEGILCNNEMGLAGKDSDSVYVIQDTSTHRQECSMVHAGQEQLQPLERPEELECSKQWSKHAHPIIEEGKDLVVDKSSAFIPCESDILSSEGICSSLNNEARKAETSIELNNSKKFHDKPAMSKLHADLPSLLDVSFTVSDTCQMRMPLEALLYNATPEQHRETVCLQESTELGPLMNFSEPKRSHGLFFVEDEDLGDFIIPSSSTLIAPVSTGNREDQGMVPGAPPNFESLL